MAELAGIARLNGENYDLWKYKLQLYLMKENLWDVVDKEKPALLDDTWEERDNKAMATIGLSLEDNQVHHVKKLTNARECWLALKKHHEKSSLSNKVIILKKLCRLQLKRGQAMEDHINDLLNLVDKLSALGQDLSDNLVVALLLSSLPDNYSSMTSALESRPEADLTVELVKEKLIQEYHREKDREAVSREKNTEGRREIKCGFCHRDGHTKNNCRILLAKKSNEQSSQDHVLRGTAELKLKSAKKSGKSK